MKIFVTGGSGFVGKYLIKELKDRGDHVTALAISKEDARIVEDAGAAAIIGDLDQTEILKKGIRGCTTVIHIAAIMKMNGDFDTLYHVNVEGTRNLLNIAKNENIKRFVHIAAAGELTGGKRAVINADESWELPEKPVGSYAHTKALGEKVVHSYNSDEFQVMVVRPPCLWGKGDPAMLPSFAEFCRQGKFTWVDHGNYPFSVCHVRNLCEGIICAMEKGRGGEVYFITDGVAPNFRDFFTDLLATQGVDIGEKNIPRWMANFMAPIMESIWKIFKLKGDPPITRELIAMFFSPLGVNDSKARRELGYQSKVSREEGLAELRETAYTGL